MRRVLPTLLSLSLWAISGAAQELTPRTYWPAPKGVKVGVLGYVYATGDIFFDPSVPLYGVDSDVNIVTLDQAGIDGLKGTFKSIVDEGLANAGKDGQAFLDAYTK